MIFKLTTPKGSVIELEPNVDLVLSIDGVKYQIAVLKLEDESKWYGDL